MSLPSEIWKKTKVNHVKEHRLFDTLECKGSVAFRHVTTLKMVLVLQFDLRLSQNVAASIFIR